MFFLRLHNCRLLFFILISSGLCDIIFGQTFQYSRGWTNGKKRSSIESVLFPETSENQEEYGICQMQRLRELWDSRRSEEFLPCETLNKPDLEIIDRHRRKTDCDRNSVLSSFPRQPN